MTAGIEVFDDAGRLQFSHDFAVASFIWGVRVPGAATVAIDFLPDQGTVRYYDLVVSGKHPLVALSYAPATVLNRHRGIGVLNVERSGSNWIFRILVVNNQDGDFGFDAWVFDAPTITSDFGFEVYDEAGGLVFSAVQPVMQLADTLQSGRRYALLHGVLIKLGEDFGDDFNNPTVAWIYSAEMGFTAQSGPNVGFQNMTLANGVTSGTQSPYYADAGLRGFGNGSNTTLVVDVTDLPLS